MSYIKLVKGATKVKVAPPKDKYMIPILSAMQSQRDFQEIINLLRDRVNNNSNVWSIVFKALVVTHMMVQENESMALEYLNENNSFFQEFNRLYGSNKWAASDINVMERYSNYLNCRAREWSIISLQPNRRDVHDDLKYVESLELQVIALMKNKYSEVDLNTDLFLFTFKLLVKDLLVLYNKLNEGVIFILESFFDLEYNDAEKVLTLYKKFVDVTEYVVRYLKVGKSIGLNIPVIKHITTKLIRSLEDHLQTTKPRVTSTAQRRESARVASTGTSPMVAPSQRPASSTIMSQATFGSHNSALAEQKLQEIREQKRLLEQQLQNQKVLMSPTIQQQRTSSVNNPFTPQITNMDAFSFEPNTVAATPVQAFQPQTTGSNPFFMQAPVQVAYTSMQPQQLQPQPQQLQQQQPQPQPQQLQQQQPQPQPQQLQQQQPGYLSLAPPRSEAIATASNPFTNAEPTGNIPMFSATNPGIMTDTATGITYVPVPVQIAAINPFDQQQQSLQQPGFNQRTSSLLDL